MDKHCELRHEKIVHWTVKFFYEGDNEYLCYREHKTFNMHNFNELDTFIEELVAKDYVFNVFLEEVQTYVNVKLIKGSK